MELIFYSSIAGLTLLITILYLYMTRNFGYWKKRGVEEIPPTPIVGNFGKYFKYKKSPGALLKSFYDQYENLPYVGIYILDKPCLLIRDPEIIKRIFIRDFNFFSDRFSRSSKNDIVTNNSIFFIENPHWRFLRQKFTNLFTSVKMKSQFADMLEVARDLGDYLDSLQLEGEGKEVDIKDLAGKYTTDLVGLFLFGLKCNSLKDPNAELRKFGKEILGTYNIKRALEICTVFLAPQFTNLFGCRFIQENFSNFFKKVFEEILDERTNSKVKKNDFLDLLIQLRDNEDNPDYFKLRGDNLLAQAIILFVAGYDSSSSIIGFSLFELAKNPEIQMKLRNKVNRAIRKNNGRITYEMVTEMEYLDMILSETLRKYPTMSILDRKATSDYKIQETGLVIEKGTPVLISLLGLHYDPQFFPDPHVFKPERFSSENKLRNPYVYLPFGIGTRNCIVTLAKHQSKRNEGDFCIGDGTHRFASITRTWPVFFYFTASRQGLLQMKLGVIYIISRFEVSLLKKTFIEFDKLSVLSSSKGGLVLNIRKINPNDTDS